MRLLDFGDSSTFPITAFDSRASLAPLMRQTDAARAIVMHPVVIEGDFERELPPL